MPRSQEVVLAHLTWFVNARESAVKTPAARLSLALALLAKGKQVIPGCRNEKYKPSDA